MFEAVLDALAQATGCDRSALDAVVGAVPDSGELGAAELVDRITAEEKACHALQAAQLRDVAAFAQARQAQDAAAGCPEHLQGRTAALEVASAISVATTTAQFRVLDADRAVADHPELLSLVGTGAVSLAGLRKVMSATEVLAPELRRVVDSQLAADALDSTLTPGQLARAAERRVLSADPGAADERAAAARQWRGVRLGDPFDGTAGVFARLRAEEALAVFAHLDRTARGMRQGGDDRSLNDLMADLFVESLLGVSVEGQLGEPATPVSWQSVDGWEPWLWSTPPPLAPDLHPDPAPDEPAWDRWNVEDGEAVGADVPRPPPRPPRLPARVELQVVISAATLLGLDDDPGMLRGYGAVPPSVVRDIVRSAQAGGARTTIRALFCDPVDGRLVAMDSAARLFTGDLRRFAVWRDQSCRLSDGRIVDVDHVLEHRHGGGTTAANAQSLGKLAHVLKDHPGIRVTTHPPPAGGDGLDRLRAHAPDVEWELPTGRTRRLAPPPALGLGSRPRPPRVESLGEQHLRALLARAA